MRSWRRWRWLSETHLCPRSLPRLMGLGLVRVDVFIAHRPLLQHHFIFNGTRCHLSKFRFLLGAPTGCIIPRPRGSIPAACILFAYALYLPCWGRPSGCIIPELLGPGPAAFAFLASI